jgi:hypothetical protein
MRHMKKAVDIVKNWINILNSGNVDLLINVSEPDLAISGPRGTIIGAEVLREWYAQTHLTFNIEELLVNGSQVISLGRVHWRNGEGLEVDNSYTAFLMDVSHNGRIAKLSRHDEGLDAAMAASNVPNRSDWQSVKSL